MNRAAIIALLVMAFNISLGQNLTFYGVLPAINHTGSISPKLQYNLYLTTTYDAFDETIQGTFYPANDMQVYIQPSLIYVLSPRINFAGSYTFQRNNPFNQFAINEHRLWQQVAFAFPWRLGMLTNRLRLEERWIENRGITRRRMHYNLSTRLRCQLGLFIPLKGKTVDPHEFYLSAYNDSYFSLTGPRNAFYSENWSYLGTGYDTGKIGRFELGYLFQSLVRNRQQDMRYLNLAQLTWITNIRFPKKQNLNDKSKS